MNVPSFDRVVTHEMATAAAMALISRAHNGSGRKSRMSIPVQANDDDIVIMDYIAQQEAKVQE